MTQKDSKQKAMYSYSMPAGVWFIDFYLFINIIGSPLLKEYLHVFFLDDHVESIHIYNTHKERQAFAFSGAAQKIVHLYHLQT